MNRCGKNVKNPVNKPVESAWEKVVEKSTKKTFAHNLVVLHMGFTNKLHMVLHKKKPTFFPVKHRFYTLST